MLTYSFRGHAGGLAQTEQTQPEGKTVFCSPISIDRSTCHIFSSLLRRPAKFESNVLKVKDITLDPETHPVTKGEKNVDLLWREAIIDRVWSSDTEASASVIRSYIQRLRSKLDTNSRSLIRFMELGID